MSNRTMLKEAIADAKTIKETAIANAKAALEESFTPHIKEMLSAKLQEMDKDEDLDEAKKDDSKDKVEEMDAPSYKRKGGESLESVPSKVGKSTVQEEEEKELDEMLAELESEIEEGKDKEKSKDELKEEEGDEDADEEIEVDVEGDDEIDLNDEEVDLEDMSEDDLKGFIEDVIKDMVDDGDLEPGDEFESEEGEDEVAVDDMEMDVDTDIEIDADELELDEAKGRSLKEGIPQESEIADYVTSMYDDSVEEREGFQSDVWTKEEYTSPTRSGGSIFIALMKHLKSVGGKDALEGNPDIHLELLSNGDIKWSADVTLNEQKEEDKEVKEALEEVNKLRAELNEVNLLNAKLLYTNKLFRAKNLSEAQKVKVLESFDNATTVKETKLVFDTLSEGIKSAPKKSINEVKGSASKAVGSINKTVKQPIVESNDMVARFQKLAGIIN